MGSVQMIGQGAQFVNLKYGTRHIAVGQVIDVTDENFHFHVHTYGVGAALRVLQRAVIDRIAECHGVHASVGQ